MGNLEAKEIQELLLHRYPILFVDRILEMEEGRRIVGLKNFMSANPTSRGISRVTPSFQGPS